MDSLAQGFFFTHTSTAKWFWPPPFPFGGEPSGGILCPTCRLYQGIARHLQLYTMWHRHIRLTPSEGSEETDAASDLQTKSWILLDQSDDEYSHTVVLYCHVRRPSPDRLDARQERSPHPGCNRSATMFTVAKTKTTEI